MTIPVRIKRRTLASGAGAPPSLLQGELAYNEHEEQLYIGIESSGIDIVAGRGKFPELPGSNGLIAKTAAAVGATPPTTAARTITGTAEQITLADGDGVSGNPTVSLPIYIQFPGTRGFRLPDGTTGQRDGSPNEGEFRYNTTDSVPEWWNGSAWTQPGVAGGEPNQNAFATVTPDSGGDAVADAVSDTLTLVGGANISTSLSAADEITIDLDGSPGLTGTPTAPTASQGTNTTQIATTAFVVTEVQKAQEGLDAKESVVAASTANGALATAFENGDTLDGVTLATGDRILLKDQSTGSENGIYTVNATGAPTRTVDADENAEVTAGLYVWVEEGTVNSDSGWVLTTNDPITVGTTALTFTQFNGANVTAGDGLDLTGSTLSVNVDGTSIDINADTLRIDPTWVGQAAITTLGTIATGTWNATAIGATVGGTAQTSYAQGDILYASAVNTLAKLAAGSNGNVLHLASGVPAWATAIDGGTF